MVGDRLLGGQEALGGRGGAAVLRAGVLAQDGGEQAVELGLVGGATRAGGGRGAGIRIGQHQRDASRVARLAERVERLVRRRQGADDRIGLAASERRRKRGRVEQRRRGDGAGAAVRRAEHGDQRGSCFGISVDDERAQEAISRSTPGRFHDGIPRDRQIGLIG
jgi:hypothetical protein